MYLLDANVLIRAHEDYYPIDRIPPFWSWLADQAKVGYAKMPFEIYDEIARASGALKDWITNQTIKDSLVLDEEVDETLFNRVLDEAYAPDLTDDEMEQAGRDPFLVTYALMGERRTVVTKEVSKPSRTRGNTKVPDACSIMGISWMTDFEFYRQLGFRIEE